MKLPIACPWGYVLAVAGVALATAGRLALTPTFGPNYPFLTYFFALLLTAWLCGLGPSVLALVLGSLAALCFVLPSLTSFGISWPVYLVGVSLYLVIGSVAISIVEAERKVRRRLEREIAQRQRVEEGSRLQAHVLESMTEGVSVSDEDGNIIYTNPAEDRIFGYGPGELIGKHVTIQNDYPPEENSRIVAEVIETLKAEGSWTGELRNRKKDGTPFWTFARITAIEREGRRYWVCVQEDITGRKRLSEQLEGERNLLDALFASTPVGLGFVDSEFRFRRVNQAVSETNGVPVEAHIGAPWRKSYPTSGRPSNRCTEACWRRASRSATSRWKARPRKARASVRVGW